MWIIKRGVGIDPALAWILKEYTDNRSDRFRACSSEMRRVSSAMIGLEFND